MTEQLSFLPTLDDAEHASWLLNGKQGVQNDCGVYVDNVFRFREKLSKPIRKRCANTTRNCGASRLKLCEPTRMSSVNASRT